MTEITSNNKSICIINYLKAFAIILVIIGHSFTYLIDCNHMTSPDWLGLIYSVHVPLFIVIAGYLCHKQVLKIYITKKITRILIPFWFFTTLKLTYSNLISSKFAHADSIGEQLYDAFILGRCYWFAYAIFFMYIIAILTWFIEDNRKRRLFIALSLIGLLIIQYIQATQHIQITDVFQIRRILQYGGFFCVGLFLNTFSKEEIGRFYNKYKFILILISIITLFAFCFKLCRNYLLFVLILSFCCSISLMVLLCFIASLLYQNIKILNIISKYSWQLMLMDSFYKIIIFKFVSKYFLLNYEIAFVIALLDVVLGVITCLIVEKIPYLNFLVGLKSKRNM